GNCEAEVDQMVLDFPCMAEYSVLWDPTATNPITNEIGRELFLTHGHIWGAGMQNSIDKPPALQKGGVLVYGHTHVKVNGPADKHPDILCFNPGSVGLPKDGSHSCGIYEDGVFTHHILEL
ncbi:MAG: metallophosphoesterase family protein, partial [Atopobiaceae bacterium]